MLALTHLGPSIATVRPLMGAATRGSKRLLQTATRGPTMHIEIADIRNRGVYRVWHDGEIIIASTATPLLSAARILLARGADPGEML